MKPFELLSFYTRQETAYNNIKNKFCKKIKLAPTAFDIVMFLYNNPEFNTAKEICSKRGIKSGIVSVEVERLVNQGLLVRSADKDDRRKQRLFLTEKTNNITEVGYKMQQKFIAAVNYGLSQRELADYHEILTKISANIDKIEKVGLKIE